MYMYDSCKCDNVNIVLLGNKTTIQMYVYVQVVQYTSCQKMDELRYKNILSEKVCGT